MKILLGTNNPAKLEQMKNFLPQTDIVTPKELGLSLNITEGTTSLIDNAILKARTYAKESNMISISADVGFFIPVLNGEPGIAGRRWGGELPETITDEGWLDYLESKIQGLQAVEAYFEFVAAIVDSRGKEAYATHRYHGTLTIKERGKTSYTPGYPAGSVFIPKGFQKLWSELSPIEEKLRDRELAKKIQNILQQVVYF